MLAVCVAYWSQVNWFVFIEGGVQFDAGSLYSQSVRHYVMLCGPEFSDSVYCFSVMSWSMIKITDISEFLIQMSLFISLGGMFMCEKVRSSIVTRLHSIHESG